MQVIDNLNALAAANGSPFDVDALMTAHGIKKLFEPEYAEWILGLKPDKLRSYSDKEAATGGGAADGVGDDQLIQCAYEHADGTRCEFKGTANSVGTHTRNAHGLRDTARALTVQSQCPLCQRVYKNVRGAADHVARATQMGRCPPAATTAKHVPRLHQ